MLRTFFTDDLPDLPTTFHYEAHGNVIPPAAQDGDSDLDDGADELLVFGADRASEDDAFETAPPAGRYHYSGRELPTDEALQYNRARHFDPSVGR
jgi:hypothetical protein